MSVFSPALLPFLSLRTRIVGKPVSESTAEGQMRSRREREEQTSDRKRRNKKATKEKGEREEEERRTFHI